MLPDEGILRIRINREDLFKTIHQAADLFSKVLSENAFSVIFDDHRVELGKHRLKLSKSQRGMLGAETRF